VEGNSKHYIAGGYVSPLLFAMHVFPGSLTFGIFTAAIRAAQFRTFEGGAVVKELFSYFYIHPYPTTLSPIFWYGQRRIRLSPLYLGYPWGISIYNDKIAGGVTRAQAVRLKR
jgi:hypothetical protein